ncbi:MAG: efflux RND transporter periplasmic adaptor subunit [Burkholderiaceae bacterium]
MSKYVMAAAASLSALLMGCQPAPPATEPLRAVKLLTVGPQTLDARTEYSAEVRARSEVRLGFQVPGKLLRRTAEVGQQLAGLHPLAEIDARDYQLGVDAAKAAVAAAQTQRDLAEADLKRFAALREQNFISGAELERRETALKAADAQLTQARAQLATQANQSGYARLLADAAGVITAVEAEPGQVLSAGMPVVRMAHDGPRDAVFAVPESRVQSLRAGAAVQVRAVGGSDALRATVREVAASADPVTRTFAVRAALPANAALPLGATVNVVMDSAASSAVAAIKLPTSAVRQEGSTSAVWVYDAATGTVRSQPVQVAGADGNEVVIAAGLQPGQQVVAAGVHVLQPGQKVTVWQPTQPASR